MISKSNEYTFIGLIDEDGVTKISFEDECSMTFSFIAYQYKDGRTIEEEIVVRKNIPSIDYLVKGLEPLSIVKIIGEQVLHHGKNRIILKSVVGSNLKNEALAKILESRLEPIIYNSTTFGIFTFNRRMAWFEGRCNWCERSIEITLSCSINEVEELEMMAFEIWNQQTSWEAKLKAKIVFDLLALKNENWLDDNEPPISENEFLSRIGLESLLIRRDGEFEAWYNDGDVFWGHAISVSANIDGAIHDCGIHG